MIATSKYCDCNNDDSTWATTATDCTGSVTSTTVYCIVPNETFITYETFEPIKTDEIDHVQTSIIINRIKAQAILGYFAPILPIATITTYGNRKINRQQRFKRHISIHLIIVMIVIVLFFSGQIVE